MNVKNKTVWLAAALGHVRLSMLSSRAAVENYDRSPDGDYRRGETTCENSETSFIKSIHSSVKINCVL